MPELSEHEKSVVRNGIFLHIKQLTEDDSPEFRQWLNNLYNKFKD